MNTQFETTRLLEHRAGVNVGRRNLLKLTGVGVAVLSMMSVGAPAFAQSTLAWDKTFPKSERVEHRKVSFYNRLGITLVADLYVPKNIDRSRAACRTRGWRPVRRGEGAGVGPLCADDGRARLRHDRPRSVLRRRERRPAARHRLIGSPRRGLQRRRRLPRRAALRGSRTHRRDRRVRQRRLRAGCSGDRPAHQGGGHRQHV